MPQIDLSARSKRDRIYLVHSWYFIIIIIVDRYELPWLTAALIHSVGARIDRELREGQIEIRSIAAETRVTQRAAVTFLIMEALNSFTWVYDKCQPCAAVGVTLRNVA